MGPGDSSAKFNTSDSSIYQSIPSIGEVLPALPLILPVLEIKAMLLKTSLHRTVWTGATVFGNC